MTNDSAQELLKAAKLARKFLRILEPRFEILSKYQAQIRAVIEALDAAIEKAEGGTK